MAPTASTRSKKRQAQKLQPGLSTTFARVSKTVTVSRSDREKNFATKQPGLEKLAIEEKQRKAQEISPPKASKSKRKRVESENEEEGESIIEYFSSAKRAKVQLPTPPRSLSERGSSEVIIPAPVQELLQIHKAFVKAFALHRAHNGPSAPAELGVLLESVTRLYQKRAVGVPDLQRILALYESTRKDESTNDSLSCSKSPFKLLVSGLGTSRRHLAEFVGYETQVRKHGRLTEQKVFDFNEQGLQAHLQSQVDQACSEGTFDGPVESYPILAFEVGAQTVARQVKVSETKKHILGGRKPDLDFGKLSVKDDSEPEASKQQTIKSRTLSLFDRVKAKQLANSAVNVPSADALRRKHAVGRIAEVVEILRMKQQQKLNGYRGAGVHGKASFSFQQIVNEIKASMSIPMGEDEIKMCLEILGKEVEDGWCTIFELGLTKSVVLMGLGKSGVEVAAMIKV
ncbi:uncharacterized protein HMPREF1541_01553 [Cyphellophora europaea CBS 101466]|uniref:DNA replication factor Cdt1 C-terminal domain-containing protein n=1 Tax=Cyphellophora europaea (strain CBS 101466) TaxID=1220924 RepID=W2S396_CYPE1|nr:uncharacterized protein HMPREF1541_01553 [Cyphellophora europaea CBS 101466]ETN42399.1 hypothetical protein HMPREF1541_01553 [Cyphellophora europaea CBS 101466]